jgi:hypothetical protein
MRMAPRRREAAACAAAITAVVTGRISTRTPRGKSSQYGSTGRLRGSMWFSTLCFHQELRHNLCGLA